METETESKLAEALTRFYSKGHQPVLKTLLDRYKVWIVAAAILAAAAFFGWDSIIDALGRAQATTQPVQVP